jgi:hypothetical protein
MTDYLPWWQGALAFAALTILFQLLISKPLGVAGSWAKLLDRKAEKEKARQREAMQESNAFLAATLAEFGEDQVDDAGSSGAADTAPGKATVVPWGAHVVFLLCILLGAMITAYLRGDFHLQMELSPLHTKYSGDTLNVWITLLIGGVFVGLGTQMAGGCTSGHGLSGCANLAPASFVATALFFGSAVVFSMLLGA